MQVKLNNLKDSVMEEMRCEMEKQSFGSTECNTKKITNAIDSVGKMIEKILAIGRDNSSAHVEKGLYGIEHLTPFVVEDEDELVDCNLMNTMKTNNYSVKNKNNCTERKSMT